MEESRRFNKNVTNSFCLLIYKNPLFTMKLMIFKPNTFRQAITGLREHFENIVTNVNSL